MIQIATSKDKDNLKKIFSEYKENFNQLYNVHNLLTSKIHKIYLYKVDESILGFIILEITYETISILHLFVTKQSRRKKIASIILDYIISEFDNIENIILEVKVDNFAAINLYKKFNFQIINTRKKYYNGIDAYVMERKIKYE